MWGRDEVKKEKKRKEKGRGPYDIQWPIKDNSSSPNMIYLRTHAPPKGIVFRILLCSSLLPYVFLARMCLRFPKHYEKQMRLENIILAIKSITASFWSILRLKSWTAKYSEREVANGSGH